MLLSLLIPLMMISNVAAFMGNNNQERPVKLRVHKHAVQKVKTLVPKDKKDPTWLLQEYMQLPAAQYACVPLPINASLERVHGSANEFTLQVPPIRFPIATKNGGDIEIIPKVRAIVQVLPDKVTIQSISCTIEGSPAVEEWKLNDRYDLDVCATLTWEKQRQGLLDFFDQDDDEDEDDNYYYDHDGIGETLDRHGSDSDIKSKSSSSASSSSSSSSSSSLPTAAASNLDSQGAKSFNSDSLVTLDPNTHTQDVIRIKTDLAIDVYPPPVKRIQMIPKRLLAKIGNMVMKYVVGLLLEAFLQGLQEDYEKWASDDSYRKERKLLEHDLQMELQEIAELERRQKQNEQRQQRSRRQGKPEDDSRGGGGGGGNSFPSFHNLNVGFLQRRRPTPTATATAATNQHRTGSGTTTTNEQQPSLRRGERIIRLIRRNNRSVTR